MSTLVTPSGGNSANPLERLNSYCNKRGIDANITLYEHGLTSDQIQKVIDDGGVVFGQISPRSITDSKGYLLNDSIRWWEKEQVVTIAGIEEFDSYDRYVENRYAVSVSGHKCYVSVANASVAEDTFYTVTPNNKAKME